MNILFAIVLSIDARRLAARVVGWCVCMYVFAYINACCILFGYVDGVCIGKRVILLYVLTKCSFFHYLFNIFFCALSISIFFVCSSENENIQHKLNKHIEQACILHTPAPSGPVM